MNKKFYGTYEAIVTDNSQFLTRGLIKVRIKELFLEGFSDDLTKGYDYKKFQKESMKDMDCQVRSLIGGGAGFGLLYVPQVNSKGTVEFLNGNVRKPIWTGSILSSVLDGDGKIIEALSPSDIPELEGNGIRKDRKGIKGDQGTVVLRTKKTHNIRGEDKIKNIQFEEQRTENLIVLSQDKLMIRHFSEWDESKPIKYQDISLYDKKVTAFDGETVETIPEIKIKVEDEEREYTGDIVINNEKSSLNFSNRKDNIYNHINTDPESVEIISKDNRNNISTIKIVPKEILLNNDESSVMIDKNEVNISCKRALRLSSESGEVILGDTGGYILVSDVPMSFRTEDGTVVSTSKSKA